MFSQNAKGLGPASVAHRPIDSDNDVIQTRKVLYDGVRDLFSPLTAGVSQLFNTIIDVAKGRYDR